MFYFKFKTACLTLKCNRKKGILSHQKSTFVSETHTKITSHKDMCFCSTDEYSTNQNLRKIIKTKAVKIICYLYIYIVLNVMMALLECKKYLHNLLRWILGICIALRFKFVYICT